MSPAGKVILITGSTDGVGRMVAERLGAAGAEVLVHGRDAGRGDAVVDSIRKAGGRATFYAADLSSLTAVRDLADTVLRTHPRLDVLVNNAGIGTGGAGGRRQESVDGHELRFAVNYLAGFLLTRLLLPRLKESAPARIVNVSSLGQQAIDFNDVMITHGYSSMRAYCQSKLAQILFTMDLAEELAGSSVAATCLHPATYMDTTMVRRSGMTPMSSVEEGCEAIMHLVTTDDVEAISGRFYNGLRPGRPDPQAFDAAARNRLRVLSERLAGLTL